jgi:hypothetical protein
MELFEQSAPGLDRPKDGPFVALVDFVANRITSNTMRDE